MMGVGWAVDTNGWVVIFSPEKRDEPQIREPMSGDYYNTMKRPLTAPLSQAADRQQPTTILLRSCFLNVLITVADGHPFLSGTDTTNCCL